jgi:hypothetical protein
VHSALANKCVSTLLHARLIPGLQNHQDIASEVRLDPYLTGKIKLAQVCCLAAGIAKCMSWHQTGVQQHTDRRHGEEELPRARQVHQHTPRTRTCPRTSSLLTCLCSAGLFHSTLVLHPHQAGCEDLQLQRKLRQKACVCNHFLGFFRACVNRM